MNYKSYRSYQTKHGVIDVFKIETEEKMIVEMFITDYMCGTTSSAIFTDLDKFNQFIGLLIEIYEH